MATANLGLEIIDLESQASPEPINENFKKVDKLAVDYIVEQGESGNWYYRKWNSGLCEFDGKFTYSSSGSSDIARCYIPFPFTLTKCYSQTVSGGISQHGNSWVMYVGPELNQLDVWMRNADGYDGSYWFMAHVVGRWK